MEKEILTICLQIVGAIVALISVYKLIFELRFQSLDKLMQYSSFLESKDEKFAKDFLNSEIKRRVYKRVTGISYSDMEDANWLYTYLDGYFSWSYLSYAFPFLKVDKKTETVNTKTGFVGGFLSTFSLMGFILSIILTIANTPVFSEPNMMNATVFYLIALLFGLGMHPYILPRVLKKAVMKKKLQNNGKV
jgi:hypothetical protein